jgi:hypothetical protein
LKSTLINKRKVNFDTYLQVGKLTLFPKAYFFVEGGGGGLVFFRGVDMNLKIVASQGQISSKRALFLGNPLCQKPPRLLSGTTSFLLDSLDDTWMILWKTQELDHFPNGENGENR